MPTTAGVGGLVDEGTDKYGGTYELEIVSPNHMAVAGGFSVEYCEQGDPAFDPPFDDVVAEPDPTHSDPTIPQVTVPPVNSDADPLPTEPTPTPTPTPTTTTSAPPVASIPPVVIGVLVGPAATGTS